MKTKKRGFHDEPRKYTRSAGFEQPMKGVNIKCRV